MLFQVSKLNEHLSIINHSQNHMQIHFTKMREREKICIWFSPKRKLKNAYENLLNYSPFTFYNYYDISQRQYTFSSCIVAWVLLTEKNLLINWYIHTCQPKEQDHVVLITFLLGRCLIPNYSQPEPLLLKKILSFAVVGE